MIGAAPAFEKLMDERADVLSEALRTGLDTIREEFSGLIEPLTFANAVRGEEMAAELVMLRRRTAELEQRTTEVEAQCREEILTLAQNAQEAVERVTGTLFQQVSQSSWSE